MIQSLYLVIDIQAGDILTLPNFFEDLVLDLGGYDVLKVLFKTNNVNNSRGGHCKSKNKIIVDFVLFCKILWIGSGTWFFMLARSLGANVTCLMYVGKIWEMLWWMQVVDFFWQENALNHLLLDYKFKIQQ